MHYIGNALILIEGKLLHEPDGLSQ